MKKIALLFTLGIFSTLLSACGSTEAVEAFEILNRRDEMHRVAYIDGDHWHGSLPEVPEGESISLGALIKDASGHVRTLDADGAHNGFSVSLYEDAAPGIVELADHGDHVHVIGLTEGTTQIVFHWMHDGEIRFTTPPIDVVVGHGHDHSDEGIDTFEIINRRDDLNKVAYMHGDHWHGSLPTIELGESLSLGAFIVSEDGRERDLDPTGEHNGLTVSLYEGAPEGIVSFGLHGDHVHIIAESAGITQIVFNWTHDGEIRYTTPPINVTVTE